MKIKLQEELDRACNNVRQQHLDHLPALGVKASVVAELGYNQAPFGVAKIQELSDGLYEPSSDGDPAMLMPVVERGGLVDIVAIQTARPERWLWRIGQGWALGLDNIMPRWDDSPFPVYATPVEWLAHAGDGLCILDWSAPDLEIEQIRLREGLSASNQMLAARLRKLLSRPRWLPEIQTMEAQHAA